MPPLDAPVADLVRRRYSCRTYDGTAIAADTLERMTACVDALRAGPLGTPLRLALIAATPGDPAALRGLGTYGFIRRPGGFIVGVVRPGERALEDFGYALETAVLFATGLGLGTCWLGGSFARSRFARRIGASDGDTLPAVVAVGNPAAGARERDPMRRLAASDARLPWAALFFRGDLETVLSPDAAARYGPALEAVRLAPSASNRQPWRVLQHDGRWHFLLRRSAAYGPTSLPFRLLGIADLQRVDVGIAMCHFALAANEVGLRGAWVIEQPPLALAGEAAEYVATWVEADRSVAAMRAESG